MKNPWLIQRCELANGKLMYELMGSTEFEVGDQTEALKRIFASGVSIFEVSVTITDKKLPVYMVAAQGFAVSEYVRYLQQLVDDQIRCQEKHEFDVVSRMRLGIVHNHSYRVDTNAWFDFRNDVLWTLSTDEHATLIQVLEGIKQRWQAADKI